MSMFYFLSGTPPVVDASVGPLVGDLQGVAVLSEALDLAAVQELAAAAMWTDVTADCEQELTIDRGIHEDSPLARLAPTGTCTLTMDNSEHNEAGLIGYYSPPNANARAGFDRGTMLRVSMLDEDGDRIPQFVGKIRSIKPVAGIYRERRTSVMATDWMDEAARFPTDGLETQRDVRADDLVNLLIDNMRNRPHGLVVDPGTDLYPFALDTSMDRHRVQFELMRIVNSERGMAYVRQDGALAFESRYARTLDTNPLWVLEEVLDADQRRDVEDVVNRVKVTIFPRRPDVTDTAPLYTNDSAMRVDHGTTTTVFLPFRDPNQEATRIGGIDLQIPPTPVTDYVINSEEDGTGVDLTMNPGIAMVWKEDATGVYLTITNTSGHRAYFTTLIIRGRGLYHYDPLPIIAEDKQSIDDVGIQQVDFEMPYQDRVGVGQGAAQLFLNSFNATPTKVSEVPFKMFHSIAHRMLAAHGDISTRITFSELVSGVSGDFYINAKRIVWRPGYDVDVTLWLAPADPETYAVFDQSVFDDPAARFAY